MIAAKRAYRAGFWHGLEVGYTLGYADGYCAGYAAGSLESDARNNLVRENDLALAKAVDEVKRWDAIKRVSEAEENRKLREYAESCDRKLRTY